MKQADKHRFLYGALLLLGIYILHFFLLDSFLTSRQPLGQSAMYTSASMLVHHPHHRRHSGLAFLRMLEKHEGAKQKVAVPVAAIPTLISHIVLIACDQPVRLITYGDSDPLSPSSYRLYLQDRVFRI